MCATAAIFTPNAAAQPAPPAEPSGQAAAPSVEPALVDATPEAVAACRQFARALDTAAASYSEFANVLAIGETVPDYTDPILTANNSYGRVGLREAASTALTASRTPGLNPAIAAPMRSWSMGAMKLMLLMGLRADVDRFNNAATELNTHTEAAQMACAEAGTQA
ncbi:Uncharacterised protein [Mycolicibacterium aurum]|uniref:Uncharacterized protein n=2 Tax=Mycolicibacterium aurum TaxID=1791 RepID=A0A448IZ06_MYCAU|nr:Uncharacterised protein [Mycolicibacterium aurum]